MGAMVSQITSLTIVFSTVYSDADQRKHQSSASLIHRAPVNSPHKWPVTRKMLPFHDVIMKSPINRRCRYTIQVWEYSNKVHILQKDKSTYKWMIFIQKYVSRSLQIWCHTSITCSCLYTVFTLFQLIRALALETAYPAYTEVKLSMHTLQINNEAIDSINYGMQHGPRRVVTGSRAEGLAMEPGWGYPHPDTDTMIIYNGEWTVWPRQRTLSEGYLGLNNAQCLPGFYRVEFNEACFKRRVFNYPWDYVRACLFVPNTVGTIVISVGFPWWQMFFICLCVIVYIGPPILVHNLLFITTFCLLTTYLFAEFPSLPLSKLLLRIFLATPLMSQSLLANVKWCKKRFPLKGLYLSSREALNLFGHVMANARLRPFTLYRAGGPTYKDLVSNEDLVPALLCSNTCSHALNHPTRLQKMLVPVGHPQSSNTDLEWRESHSLIEIQMACNWPIWVKQAYWAFKYTFRYCMDASYCTKAPSGIIDKISSRLCDTFQFIMHIITGSIVPSHSSVQSYHLKTILLWVLKERQCGNKECPYLLYMRLVKHMITALENRKLPNYFIPGCNLLDGVSSSEIDKALSCLQGMLADPQGTMMSAASKPNELYGHKNGFQMRDKLLAIFKNLDHNVNFAECSQNLSILRSHLLVLDQYRKKRYINMRRREESIWTRVKGSTVNQRLNFKSLVGMLDRDIIKHIWGPMMNMGIESEWQNTIRLRRILYTSINNWASIHYAVRRLTAKSLEAARSGVIMIVSLWNLTGSTAAVLPRCLSNFSAIEKF